MNRKIIAIFALLIVAAGMSAVSAFDLGDIFGGGENQTATIGGVDFNIPAGYENDTQAVSSQFTKHSRVQDTRMMLQDMPKAQPESLLQLLTTVTLR